MFDGRQSGSIETVAVRASDTRKGEAAAAEFREAVKAHNERLMAAEENRTAAFPITVTLQYIGRTSGLDDGSTLGGDGSESDGGSGRASGDDSGDASGGTDGGLTGGDTASEGSGGDDGDNGGFAVPRLAARRSAPTRSGRRGRSRRPSRSSRSSSRSSFSCR